MTQTVKLISEEIQDVEYICEENENGKKDYKIRGIFMQADIKNRNGRVYPVDILEKEVNRYSNEYINKGRALGELGHPQGPQINLERVSHVIKELRRSGDNFVGKAEITETPYGSIARGLMESGARLGVSSRGMGSLKANKDGINEVQDDFYLATAADIVADPSAPDAFVNGIMEGVEWVWDNGIIHAQQVAEQTREKVEESVRSRELNDKRMAALFENFMNSLVEKR